SGIQTLQTGGVLYQRCATNLRTAIVGLVTRTMVRPPCRCRWNETTTIGVLGCHAPRSRIDRPRQAAHPTVEIIPAEHMGGSIACLVIFRPRQMEFTEHGA